MNRLLLHLNVPDLSESVAFYRALFGVEPTRSSAESAEWLLDDPGLDFRVSERVAAGLAVRELGLEFDDANEFAAMKARLMMAARPSGLEPGSQDDGLADSYALIWANRLAAGADISAEEDPADPPGESIFVHHRREQRRQSRDRAYTSRGEGRM